jgi:putative heme iron utilization protein
MLRQDSVTARVRVLDVTYGTAASIVLRHIATRPDGKQRTITQKVSVPDANLVRRLSSEVVNGDEIDATVVTDWTDQGYSTHLAAYSKVSDAGSTTSRELVEVVKAS